MSGTSTSTGTVTYAPPAKSLLAGSVMEPKEARELATSIFSFYDRKRLGELKAPQLVNLLLDCQLSNRKHFHPSVADIDVLHRVLDRDSDSKVTESDFVTFIEQILVDREEVKQQEALRRSLQRFSAQRQRVTRVAEDLLRKGRKAFWEFDVDRSGYLDDEGQILQLVHKVVLEEWKSAVITPQGLTDRFIDWLSRYKRVKRNVLTSREFEDFMIMYLLEVAKMTVYE